MSVSESDRRDLFINLESVLGPEPANNLMKLLPYHPADQLVTRADMHAHGAQIQGEMAELRGELVGEMAELRSDINRDMAKLRSDIRGDMDKLGGDMDKLRGDMTKLTGQMTELTGDMFELRGQMSELRGQMSELRGQIDNRLADAKVATQRLVMGAVAANVAALIGGMLL